MKIFIVIPHGHPLNKADKPTWFTVPDSALLRTDKKFYIPDFDSKFVAYAGLAFKVSRLGKGVNKKFATRYYSETGPAFCVCAANLLDSGRATGSPWDQAVVFDYSFWVGNMHPCEGNNHETYSLSVSVETEGKSPTELTADCPDNIAEAVEMISHNNTIKMGDLIVLLTEATSVTLAPHSYLRASINGTELFKTYTK